MMNMSRIVNCEAIKDCKPWRAPNLVLTTESSYDFGENNNTSLNGLTREQQTQISQQAYEKSYAKGYMEGLAKGQKEMREQLEHIPTILAALAMPLPEVDNQVVDELAQLSMAVVKQMVRRELKISPGEIVAVVREALSMLPATPAEITLELHPDDATLIRDTLVSTSTELNWKIVEDPLLTRGGCRVLTSTSRIDASVEKRMNAIIADVMGGERMIDEQKTDDSQ
jgi:flagellar assembly protein FliH